jgi:ATP-dependent Clp protease ATP-binding subunit ClpA
METAVTRPEGWNEAQVTRHAERICDLAHASAKAGDADEALRALAELRAEVDACMRAHVERALCTGRSFSDVARALGISRQAAHRRFRDLAPKRRPDRARPLTANEAARRVVRLAQAEALAAGAPAGSEHVLLGVLRTNGEITQALREQALTPERVRAYTRDSSGDCANGRTSSSIPRIVRRAAQVALIRGDRELGIQPLLLAAVVDPDGGARRTLAALGIEPAALRKWLH